MKTQQKPVILCILDGWGYSETRTDNAVAMAKTPNWDRLLKSSPQALLKTCGRDVGLPTGQMGNSEVGHMNLGAGRVVMQDLPRIDSAIEDGSLKNHPILKQMIETLKSKGRSCHLMGLYSPGGVHSHQDHIVALCKILNDAGIPTYLHLWTDGRDTPPQSAIDYVSALEQELKNLPHIKPATLCGRYYAMDRDKRWERVELAYNAIVDGKADHAPSLSAAIKSAHDAGETDEFIKPRILPGFQAMQDGDAILCANFRSDRVRQIMTALLDPDFHDFARRPVHASVAVAMTEYSADLANRMQILFTPQPLHDLLGEVVAKAGKRQLRMAETEKYPHVTFFFNGGEEKQYTGEDRILVPSPKVATYDLQPEMSAIPLTDKLVEAIESAQYDFILINYANPDMVGHSGILEAAIKACETVDICLGRVMDAVEKMGGVMLVTADHGNAEMMRDPETGEPHTAHTLNPVKLVLFNDKTGVKTLKNGRLADVAPSVLRLLNLPQPASMTGTVIL
ncbi:MAG: 2,3-bisphosphoglycerate-independent phosphoglycerate mutase [Alphaproteobacteria bacterium]|nr:MAG: 2,3-bisphosphoglycerate-independent phosphoglycerate mutase [Alphaproteobacteria bacterium]